MISEVYYTEIDKETCDPRELGRFYFLHNLLGETDYINERYIDHEMKQSSIRNNIIADAIKKGIVPRHPNINSTILGLSSLHDAAILVINC